MGQELEATRELHSWMFSFVTMDKSLTLSKPQQSRMN